jgi:hypothetical protein
MDNHRLPVKAEESVSDILDRHDVEIAKAERALLVGDRRTCALALARADAIYADALFRYHERLHRN